MIRLLISNSFYSVIVNYIAKSLKCPENESINGADVVIIFLFI